MKKAESGGWAKLDIPRTVVRPSNEQEEALNILEMAKAEPMVDSLDLDDLDITTQKFQLSDAAKTKAPMY